MQDFFHQQRDWFQRLRIILGNRGWWVGSSDEGSASGARNPKWLQWRVVIVVNITGILQERPVRSFFTETWSSVGAKLISSQRNAKLSIETMNAKCKMAKGCSQRQGHQVWTRSAPHGLTLVLQGQQKLSLNSMPRNLRHIPPHEVVSWC